MTFELTNKSKSALLKAFNIKLNKLRLSENITNNCSDLYQVPLVHNQKKHSVNYIWIWTGKRKYESTISFPINRTTIKSGYYCSCMDDKNGPWCLHKNKWKALLFPINDLSQLQNLGYSNVHILVNESKS